ncbi:flavin reductase family protein [Helicobacter sp. 13S00477-4]|uniref:flavin reductase family protein n=1 Tax=Helicobacter sp. 13S00477-4 TaxID=1905759 RepID=UPI000BA508BB|nr:flavin reductase family protein [Helicobacter sp. 13S00477-4]PAF50811.1 hypothetical protein BKH44_06565 [Helicobacter sp. 13S00477-4]
MQIDFNQSSPLVKYKILSNSITPRPIAWTVTTSKNGVVNLAPFSFFAPISSDPIVFSLCLTPKSDGRPKDTLKNITDTEKAMICMCEEKNLKFMNQSATELEYDTSEATKFQIELEIINSNYPPIIKGTNIAFMCKLYDLPSIGKNSQTIFLEASNCFIDDKIYRQDLNFTLQNIGRVGKYYQLSSNLIDPKSLL